MDLSKAYDCLPHDLLIAKLAAYGVGFSSLSLLHDYLCRRYHRVKIRSIFSKWLELKYGVPQGSILGPLLFNVFFNDFFMFIQETEACNFADDNSLYASSSELDEVISVLERELARAIYWYKINSMAANPGKFQAMFLGTQGNNICLHVEGVTIKASSIVKLLGVQLDCKLNFQTHVQTLCKTASQKINALMRIRPFLNVDCAKRLCSAYILSAFQYCPLIWMFGSKCNNGLINRTHKRALRAVYSDFRTLMVEVFKSLNRLNPEMI